MSSTEAEMTSKSTNNGNILQKKPYNVNFKSLLFDYELITAYAFVHLVQIIFHRNYVFRFAKHFYKMQHTC